MGAPVTHINRAVCKILSEDIMDALEAVAERHGLTLDRKGGKYDDASFTLPVIFSIAEFKTKQDNNDFLNNAAIFGVDPDWLDREFTTSSGKTLKIVGLNTRAPKNCIKLEDDGGRSFKCSPEYVRQFLD